jgi:hypothetical protein
VLEPWLDVKVTRNGSNLSGARVYLYPLPRGTLDEDGDIVNGECGGRVELTSSSSTTESSDGGLPSSRIVGHPFGQYEICAQASISGSTRHRRQTVTNDTPAGKQVPISLTTTSSGSCPNP